MVTLSDLSKREPIVETLKFSKYEVSMTIFQANATNPIPPHLKMKLIALAFSLGTAFGYGFLHAFSQRSAQSPQSGSSVEVMSLSMADYERLKLGMSVVEAQAILGRGVEVSQTETTVTLVWVSPDGLRITAVFGENRLTSKEQVKLQ